MKKQKQNENSYSLVRFFEKIIKRFSQFFASYNALYKKIYRENRQTIQRIQLTCIYALAMITLMFSFANCIGYFPDVMLEMVPFSTQIIQNPAVQYFATPEKIFFFYLLVIETIMNRPIFKMSVLIKYNILLIFILEMVQNLLISWWDLFFSREMDIFSGSQLTERSLGVEFLFLVYLLSYTTYLYSYIQAMNGRFPVYPGIAQNIPDSVAFWLRLRKIQK